MGSSTDIHVVMIGGFTVPDGTALAPAYGLSSESSLGWYRSAASTLALSYGTVLVPLSAASTFLVATAARFIQSGAYTQILDNDGQTRVFFATAAGDSGHMYLDIGNNAAGAFIFRSNTDAEVARIYSRGTVDFLQSRLVSIRTMAASALTASAANTALFVNEMAFTIQASGASLAINSGGTTWIFSSVASAKNT